MLHVENLGASFPLVLYAVAQKVRERLFRIGNG